MSQSDPNHYSDIDPNYLQFYTPIYTATTIISLVANTTVVVFHWLMVWYKVAEFNRVSLRLIVLASCFGMVRSIVRMAMGVPADTVTCLVDSFFLGWTEIAAPLCLGMVGVHAVCVLVLSVKNPLRQEKYYYTIIILYSLVTSLVSVTHRTKNYPEDFHCWVRFYFGSKQRQPFAWIWYYSLLLLPITLAALCSLILTIRYKMERHNFVETSVRYAQNNNPYLLPAIPTRRRRVDPIKTFRNLIIRSTFYALVPLVSKIFLVISGLTSLRGYSTNFYALIIGGLITNLQGKDAVKTVMINSVGLLISILYFSDPAVIFTLGRLGRFLRKVYVDEYQLPDDKPTDDNDLMEVGGYDSDDLRTGDGSEDDIGGAIRLAHGKHDMIAVDTSTMEPTHGHYRLSQHHYWKHHYGHPPQGLPPYYQRVNVDTTRRMQDPYRYRWLAKAMHLFLTSVCRLKPLPPTSDSTSTLSYHSHTLSRLSTIHTYISSLHLASSSQSSGADDRNTNSSTSINSINSTDNSSSSSSPRVITDKDRVPVVRFNFVTPENRSKKNGRGETTAALSTLQAVSDDNQQLLALPIKTATTPNGNVSPHDSLPSTNSSRKHSDLISSSLDSSAGLDLSDDSGDAKDQGMGSPPMASSRLARQSKKFRQVMLHTRPENSHTLSPDPSLDYSQQASLQIPPPSPTIQHISSSDNRSSTSSSSNHLSIRSSEEDVDRLSLLSLTKSMIELWGNEIYEPLSAPPHYYQHRRQQEQLIHHHDITKTTTTNTMKATSATTIPTLPQLSITLPDQETQQDQTQLSASSSSSSSAPILSPTTTTTMELIPPDQQQQQPQQLHEPGLKHGVELTPAVVKTLLDWGPSNTFCPAYVDHFIMESDGLGYGYTDVVHIQQSWNISAHGTISRDNGSRTLGVGGSVSDSISSSRLVFFVEHWVKGYLGSRWFVVE